MAIAQSKTRDQFPLSPKKVIKKTLSGTIVWSVLLLFVFIGLFSIYILAPNKDSLLLLGGGAIFVLWLVMVVLNFLYQKWYFNTYFYDLTDNFVIIKKGPITPSEITIPYERIQDVYVDQDLFDRFFGLYDVHISSATASSGMEAHIDGLEKPAADGLRQLLLQTVSVRISRHQQPQVQQPSQQPDK